MIRQHYTLPWRLRWWRRPGDSLWSATIANVRWEVDLEEVAEDSWRLALRRDDQPVIERLEWKLSARDFFPEDAGDDEQEPIPSRVLDSLRENLQRRARGIKPLDATDIALLEQSVLGLPQQEWISGRKLRQKLKIEDPAQFQQHISHLVPRYLRVEPSKEGDFYSPTLAGLFRIDSGHVNETVRHLISALVRRYDLDPDARAYDWADLAAVGLPMADIKLAWAVASITLLGRGGGMTEGAVEPAINLGMPLDAEQIVIASRNMSFREYVIEAANLARERSQFGPIVDRPWLSAPAYLERDGALEDFVSNALTAERRSWSVERGPSVSMGRPMSWSNGRAATAAELAPFHLRQIYLSDIRGFSSLEIPLARSSPDSGQWVIILGTNGSGKTSILRAITLALSSDEVVQALLGRLGTSAPMVRLGAGEATIHIKCPTGHLPRLMLGGGDTGDRLVGRGSGEILPPFVVAYGCRRGSALGGASREVNAASPLSAVETLFDEGASLVHAETWLKERKLAALEQGGTETAFYEAVEATLIGHGDREGLLPGIEKIHVGADLVEVEGPAVGRIPFAALSDGYLTTAGWILDLIARWSEEARRRGIVLDGAFGSQMTGVAIVDEIDLHIHPRWQRDVIRSVRKHFPRLSFIVTTHNPLTLLGGHPGEIYVLELDDATSQYVARQRDLPPGADVERILTGDWFGLDSTLDDATLKLLAEHRQLLRAGSAGSPRAKQLERELTKRLGSFAATSIERLAQSAAAQVLEDETRDLSTADREAALAKIVEIMRVAPRAARKDKATRVKPRFGARLRVQGEARPTKKTKPSRRKAR